MHKTQLHLYEGHMHIKNIKHLRNSVYLSDMVFVRWERQISFGVRKMVLYLKQLPTKNL
ncbi:hypothetical protein AAG906_023336 [Vitis piasezkii]